MASLVVLVLTLTASRNPESSTAMAARGEKRPLRAPATPQAPATNFGPLWCCYGRHLHCKNLTLHPTRPRFLEPSGREAGKLPQRLPPATTSGLRIYETLWLGILMTLTWIRFGVLCSVKGAATKLGGGGSYVRPLWAAWIRVALQV